MGAILEDGNATGIGGDDTDDSGPAAGAVYLFERDATSQWAQHVYVKASNPGSADYFGMSVALSANADTLAVSAGFESSNATGIGGDQGDDSLSWPGAVYLY